jgi:hypothetical protein
MGLGSSIGIPNGNKVPIIPLKLVSALSETKIWFLSKDDYSLPTPPKIFNGIDILEKEKLLHFIKTLGEDRFPGSVMGISARDYSMHID